MRFLHTMIRVSSLTDTLHFFCDLLGCQEIKRTENSTGRYTLVYLAAPEDLDTAEQYAAPLIELTYNWDENGYAGGRNFGHIAFSVNNIYDICDRLKKAGMVIKYGLYPHAGWHFYRASSERSPASAARALDFTR